MIRRLLIAVLLTGSAWAGVDPATSNAVERLLAGAKANPIVVLMAGDAIAEGEADVRKAMAKGLTREQAKDIVAGLDTATERERALGLLRMAGADSDIVLVLRWVLEDVKRALAQSTVKPESPPTGPPWQERIGRQMILMAAPQYWWHDQTDVDYILDTVLASGADGISVEYGGSWIADEYNKIKTTESVAAIYARRHEQWAKWDEGLRKRGLVAHVTFLNSNQSAANKIGDGEWRSIAERWAKRYRSDNKLALPLSESDSRTRSSIGDAIYKGLLAGGIPRSQLISMGGNWGDWKETHHGRGKVPSGNHRTINVNDNGPSIEDLYGGNWTSGGVPNAANIRAYVSECRSRGVSCVVYSFGRMFDPVGLTAAMDGWGRPAAPGKAEWRYIGTGEKDVGWSPNVDRSGWPTKSVDGSICDGLLFGAKVGSAERKVEWIKRGASTAHTKNAWAYRNDKKYNQGWVAGDDVVLSVRDINGNLRPGSVRGTVRLK